MITVNVDLSGLNRKLAQLKQVTKGTTASILKQQARLLAVELAYYTQPMGDDESARVKSEAKIDRDYANVYPSADNAKSVEFIGRLVGGAARNNDPGARGRIKRYLETGNTAAAEKMMRDMHIKLDIARRADPAYHKARWSRGRLRRGPMQIVTTKGSVAKLVREAKRKIGFAKSGWASAARQLGGTRAGNKGHSIPGWVSRQRCPGVAIITNGGMKITLINQGDFTSQVLSEASKQLAVNTRAEAIRQDIDRILKGKIRQI